MDHERLSQIHQSLTFAHGSLNDEYDEQLMSVANIQPDDRVLELGGDVGRNSCTIARLLRDSSTLVVFEPSALAEAKLKQNRDTNGLKFHIESAALSRVPLVHRDWDTKPLSSEALNDGWRSVPTLSWADVKKKYGTFNVLVADCEGALYYILKDEPDLLSCFQKILIENDFKQIEHKLYVDALFVKNGMHCTFSNAGGGGPCRAMFYEVWSRV